jgi:glycogen(starch) synthase
MHVLMTADTVGGVWTYTRELVSGLVRRGHRITLISFGKLPCTSQLAWMLGLPGLDYRPTPYALEWMQDAEEDIQLSTKYLEHLIAETKPDLLHFNQFAYGAIKTSLPKVVVAHSDVVSWWLTVKAEEPPATDWMKWYRRTVSRGLAGADTVIAPSHCMLNNIDRYYGHPVHAQVIYNGRDPALFDSDCLKEHRAVSIGRVWDEAKQVSLLMRYSQAAPVTVVGDGNHPDEAMAGFAGAKSSSEITFAGPQSEQALSALLARSSIYAACSRYEPFGLAPLEAALSRCALVANDIPTFHEIWGDAAFYFATNDARSLSDAIRQLSSEPMLCREYADRAYERAQHFTAVHMIEAYEQLYGAVVAQEAAA